MIEHCRECSEIGENITEAEFILWGKLLLPNALGPKCRYHAEQWLGGSSFLHLEDGYAVFDLRPLAGAGELLIADQSRDAHERFSIIAERLMEEGKMNDVVKVLQTIAHRAFLMWFNKILGEKQ
jgi:hypothetical protein